VRNRDSSRLVEEFAGVRQGAGAVRRLHDAAEAQEADLWVTPPLVRYAAGERVAGAGP
jgi:hypothetical protein